MAHLQIGRSLAARIAPEQLEDSIFDIVNQFDRGAELITEEGEREQVASLNLIAGKRAKAASASAAAVRYLVAGCTLLGKNGWERNYRLAFDLELHLAECEYLIGQLTDAEQRLAALSARAQTTIDSAAVAYLRLNLHMIMDRCDEAVIVGLEYLHRRQPQWSPHPIAEDVKQECSRLWRQLESASVEVLLDLPMMSDPEQRATMNVLTALAPAAQFTDLNLWRLIIIRMVALSLEHGNTDGSCLAYALLGSVPSLHSDHPQDGFRVGRLALDLVEKRGFDRVKGFVYLAFALHVAHWTQRLATSQDLLRRAFEAARDAGDLVIAACARVDLVTNLLATGESLKEVEREAESALAFVQSVRFGLIGDVIVAQLRLIRTLRGQTLGLDSFNDGEFDESAFEQHLEGNPRLVIAASRYWIRKLQAKVHAGNYASAVSAALKAASLLWTLPSQQELPEYHFYAALAWAGHCDSMAAEQRHLALQELRANHELIAHWTKSGPENFAHQAMLLGAELARLEGRERDAMRLYEEAVRSAKEQGFVHNEGMANELAARFWAARGFQTMGDAYLQSARHCYLSWGAVAKVQQLDQLYRNLRQEGQKADSTRTIGEPEEYLDLATVIKVSQAVSGEIVLEKLIHTLLRTALEHTGAERGLLILQQGAELRIQAEVAIRGSSVAIDVREAPISAAELPESIIRYAARTQEIVILDDGSAPSAFSSDEYVGRKRARSVLCLPVIKQGTLVALLYLENNLAPRVFTPARVAVLKLVASQAAISLENIRLYREVAEREAKIRRLVDSNIIGILIFDLEGRIIEANDAFLHTVGYDREDLVAGRMRWTDLTPPKWRDHDAQRVEEVKMTGTAQAFEKEYFRKDGSCVPVLVGAASFEDTGNQGVAFVLDLTERKRAEAEARESEQRYREMQMELAHANRVSTMGLLTASIAHEVNQPITAAVTDALAAMRWLRTQPPNFDEVAESLARIVSEGNRAGEVIRRIRILTKKAPPRKEDLEINEAVLEVIALTRAEVLKNGVTVRTQLAEGLPVIRADRVQLQQVILNLIINAVEAMRDVGEEDRELLISTSNQPDGVCVEVRDSGPGFAPAALERLFEAFYTTKPGGLGLGLSICRLIIEAHNGRLWARPNLPRGAIFSFIAPAHPAAAS
jgi:PAS domain S-box-containing protein